MILLNPSLFVRRLVVYSTNKVVFDEEFSDGLNFIAGEHNAVGKSTLANLLFYSLGGDYTKWTPEAGSCTAVRVEVEINGAIITLERPIETVSRRPMRIYWGDLASSAEAKISEWEEYPFSRSDHKESFSSVLLRAMDIPIVDSSMQSIVTMNQLLRLIYVDQDSAHFQIFRTEPFDKPQVREAVGAVLSGYYSDKQYGLISEHKIILSKIENIDLRLNSLDELLSEADQNISLLSLESQIDKHQQELGTVREYIEKTTEDKVAVSRMVRNHKKQLEALRKKLDQAVQNNRNYEQEHEQLVFEVADSNLFISSLELSIDALAKSESIRDALGEVPFRTCPVCYHGVSQSTTPGVCPLCKEEVPPGTEKAQVLRMRQELSLQLAESRLIQESRIKRLEYLESELPASRADLATARTEYERLYAASDLKMEVLVGPAYKREGYLQAAIEDLNRQLRLVETYQSLQDEKRHLVLAAKKIDLQIGKSKQEVEDRRSQSLSYIAKSAMELLRQDELGSDGVPVEEEFVNGTAVQFDFGENAIAVDGRYNFSASSLVILKNVLHLAIFKTSLEIEWLRYPRLLIMDNIEDKGMQPSRSHNFQKMMEKVSREAKVRHQIIATTSMLSDEYIESDYLVGRYYRSDQKTLDL